MPDSAIAVAERIVISDTRNIPALRLLATTYRAKIDSPRPGVSAAELANDTTKLLDALGRMAAADPTNMRLVQDVINTYPQLGRPKQAIPLVRDLLQNNPGDPALLNLAWLVYLNSGEYQSAIDVGTEMARVDTAAATADFYRRVDVAVHPRDQPPQTSEA